MALEEEEAHMEAVEINTEVEAVDMVVVDKAATEKVTQD